MSVDIASLVMAVDSRQVAEGTKNLDAMALAGKKAEASTLALEAANKVLAAAARTVSSAFAAYKIMDLIRDSAMLAARFETMGVVMKVAGNNAGYTRVQMEEYSKALQKSGISMMESRNVLVQLSTANIDLANAAKLGRAAQDLAVVGNINSSEALGRLVHGLKSGEVEILRTLGLNVKFEDGYKKMAAQLGTTSEKLTEQQKVLSRTNSALTEAAKYQGIYEESMTTAGKAMTSLARYWEDFMVKAGDAFLPTLATSVFGLTDALKAMNNELEAAGQSGLIDDVAQYLNGTLKTALQAVAILGANVAFVFKGMGREIGALAAQGARLAVLDFKGAAAIGEAATEDADAARRALEAFEQRMLSVGQTAKVVATQTEQQRIATGKASRDAAEAEEKRMAAAAAAAKASKNAGDTAKTTADEFQKLWDKIAGKASGTDADFSKNIGLLNKALADGRLSWEDYTKVVGQYIAQQPAAIEASKAATKAMEEQAMATYKLGRAELDEAEAIEAWRKAQNDAAAQTRKSIDERITGLQDEAAATTLAAEQNISLAQAIEQVTINRLKEHQAVLLAGSDAYDNVQKEIEARERLIGVINTKDLREKESAGWSSVFASIDSTAHEAWTNVWESGSSAFKRLGQTLKASILDVLYQMTVRPFIVKIGASILGGGFATAANAATGSGTGVLSGIGNLSGLLSGGTSAANFAGTAYANLTGTGLDGLLATNAAFGTAAAEGAAAAGVAANVGIGTAAGLTAAEATAAASAAGAAAGAGLMTTLAPLLNAAPYLAAIAGVYMLTKKLDHSGTPHTGGGSSYSAASGLSSTTPSGWTGGSSSGDGFGSVMGSASTVEMTSGLVKSIVGILDSTATTFGKTAGYAAATSFADDSSKDPAWGSLVIKQLDNVLVNWNDTRTSKWAPRQFSDGSAGSAEYLAAVSQDVRKALEGIGLPGWATSMLDKLGASPTLDQLAATVAEINKTETALVSMGKVLVGFSGMGETAVGKLIDASGGINNLAANASTYYDNFYTEGEKQAATLKTVADAFAAVSVPMPATREAFRTLVESLEATADTNPYASAALATVLSMSGAFASVVPAAADTGTAVIETAQEIATLEGVLNSLRNPVRSIEDIAQGIFNLESEGQSLQVELWRTYGDSNSLLAANKLQRDIETAGMTKQELRLYNLNAARRAEIDTIVQQRQAHADAVASWQTYFDLFATPQEKQTRARAIVQAVLPADVDTLQEYKDYVWGLTVQFGLGSAEMKAATDVAQQFAVAFPEVAQEITEVSAASTVLTKDLSAYYAALFTPAEQVGYATGVMAQKFADLGLTMPTTVQGFKDLVAGLDTTTEAGRVAYNTVVGLAGAWKDLQPAVAAAVTATTDLSAYHAAYFTEAERAGLATTSLTATLASVGLALPTTRDGFRALVQAQDLNTEAGIRTYNTLIGVAGAFADLVPAATVGAAAVETLGDLLTRLRNPVRTLEQIAGNIVSLEEELFQAQNAGNTAALRGHILDGLSDVKDSVTGLSERDLQGLVWSLQDSAQAALDLAAANKIAEDEAARAADAIATEMQRAADAAAAAAQKIASEHDSLWRQWLTVNEDTAALRALDLAALDPSNRALQEQIWALEDQKKAADEATSAAEQMRSAWGSLTDSMIDEVRRIRGLIDESSGASYASLAAQFATATAQTRAGDQTAAKLLPGLSQNLLTAYEASATSLVDLQRVRALTANSLEQTAGLLGASPQTLAAALPNGTATATGTALNSYAPAAVTAPGPSLTDVVTELRAEIAALKDEVKGLRGEAKATSETIAINTGKTARLNQKWDDVGLPITTETDLAAVYGA